MKNEANEHAAVIRDLTREHTIRVAVDGFCAAGKTTFADHLSEALISAGRSVIRATTDDFQNPPEIRYRHGKESPVGFYRDAIDFTSIRHHLLDPLGPGGKGHYRTSTFDIRNMTENLSAEHAARPDSILVMDGLFLLSAELSAGWDYSIFIDTPSGLCIDRAKKRNQEGWKDLQALEAHYRQRYVPGFQMYLDQDRPRQHANFVLNNAADFNHGS